MQSHSYSRFLCKAPMLEGASQSFGASRGFVKSSTSRNFTNSPELQGLHEFPVLQGPLHNPSASQGLQICLMVYLFKCMLCLPSILVLHTSCVPAFMVSQNDLYATPFLEGFHKALEA